MQPRVKCSPERWGLCAMLYQRDDNSANSDKRTYIRKLDAELRSTTVWWDQSRMLQVSRLFYWHHQQNHFMAIIQTTPLSASTHWFTTDGFYLDTAKLKKSMPWTESFTACVPLLMQLVHSDFAVNVRVLRSGTAYIIFIAYSWCHQYMTQHMTFEHAYSWQVPLRTQLDSSAVFQIHGQDIFFRNFQ